MAGRRPSEILGAIGRGEGRNGHRRTDRRPRHRRSVRVQATTRPGYQAERTFCAVPRLRLAARSRPGSVSGSPREEPHARALRDRPVRPRSDPRRGHHAVRLRPCLRPLQRSRSHRGEPGHAHPPVAGDPGHVQPVRRLGYDPPGAGSGLPRSRHDQGPVLRQGLRRAERGVRSSSDSGDDVGLDQFCRIRPLRPSRLPGLPGSLRIEAIQAVRGGQDRRDRSHPFPRCRSRSSPARSEDRCATAWAAGLGGSRAGDPPVDRVENLEAFGHPASRPLPGRERRLSGKGAAEAPEEPCDAGSGAAATGTR